MNKFYTIALFIIIDLPSLIFVLQISLALGVGIIIPVNLA